MRIYLIGSVSEHSSQWALFNNGETISIKPALRALVDIVLDYAVQQFSTA
eukprot:SAG31_NODE_10032_length_1193_cov_1.134369_1_plen_49_part_10